jgi:hypothetical protein
MDKVLKNALRSLRHMRVAGSFCWTILGSLRKVQEGGSSSVGKIEFSCCCRNKLLLLE